MSYQKKNELPGPKTDFPIELGKGVNRGLHVPPAIHALLKLKPVRVLLGCMATNEHFKQQILDQVPKEESSTAKQETRSNA